VFAFGITVARGGFVDERGNGLTGTKPRRYEGVNSRRRRRHAGHPPASLSSSDLSDAETRIAEALAALLVAHYRKHLPPARA
jgi:hypothetical protein